MTTTAPRAGTVEEPRTGTHDALLRTVVSIATNVTVLTALLVYFGWKRSDSQARALGLDETIFGLSTRDYLLRSVDALFVPLGLAAVAGLGWLWLDGQIRRRLSDPAAWTPISRAVRVGVWSWLFVPALAVIAGLLSPAVGLVVFPLSFGLGALGTAYAVHLRRDLDGHRGLPPSDRAWRTEASRGLVVLIVLLSLFWTITNVADSRGRALAVAVERDLSARPAVVVHSRGPLGLEAPGVAEERLAENSYRYSGLRLLHHHGTRSLLVHDGWTRRDGVLIVLDDEDDVRLEFVTGGPR